VRVTRPAASSEAAIRVIDGGWTRSAAASSRGLSGPRRSSVARVASWVRVSEVSARSERIRRASRMTARRSELARAVCDGEAGTPGSTRSPG
jgi:hypothetical protein